MSDDAARDRLDDVLASLQSQVADIAAVQKKQAELRVEAQSADDTVEVTVNARGQLVNIAIDKSYLDDHEFEELSDYVLEAAQAAVGEARQRVAEILAPINERDKSFPTFSDIVEDIPELRDVMPPGLDDLMAGAPWKASSGSSAGGVYDDGDDGAQFPTVRR